MIRRNFLYLFFALIASYWCCNGSIDVEAVLQRIGRHIAIKTLGWDPYYTLYEDTHAVENAEECTIYCHGFGENQQHALKKRQCDLLHGAVISFDFECAVYGKERPDFAKTSFGQWHETQALLYLLKHLDDAGMSRFHLYGYSQGAAVILNAVKQLICYVEHKYEFKKLQISRTQALSILDKIKAGTIVLDCPLLDMRAITKQRCAGYNGFMDLFVCTSRTLFKYAPWKDQGIKSAHYVKLLDLALLVHFQNPDKVVTNACDIEFYEIIQGARTSCVIGTDEGHLHTGKTLAPALREFRKLHGGSYKK